MKKQAGFTLVELLLAATFFAYILIFVTAAFVQINRAYNRGITVKRVHESTRQNIQDIARTIQSAQYGNSIINTDTDGLGPNYLCIGDVRYVWYEFDGTPPVTPPPFYLLKDTSFANCSDPVSGDEIDLLDNRLAVQDLCVYQIGLSIAYGIRLTISVDEPNSTFLDSGSPPVCGDSSPSSQAQCNVLIGDQYCNVATLDTVVTIRR